MHKLPLVFPLLVSMACRGADGDVTTASAALGLELGDGCPEIYGIVPTPPPTACEPSGNSSVTTEVRYVPWLGFIDGIDCAVWPRRITLDDNAALLQRLLADPQTSDARWLMERMQNDDATMFGSKRALSVRRLAWGRRDRRVEVPAVFDVEGGYGMVLDPSWICTVEALESGACTTVDGEINGKPLKILGREQPQNPRREAVVLVAPRVSMPESITLDLDVVIAADRVSGVSQRGAVDVVARAGWADVPGDLPSAMAALKGPAEKPVLAVLAKNVDGVGMLSTQAKARVETLLLTTPSQDALAKAWQGAGGVLNLSFALAVPAQTGWQVNVQEFKDWFNTVTQTTRHATVTFASPPDVRTAGAAGGATQLVMSSGAAPSLTARGIGPVEVQWSKDSIDAYAAALAEQLTVHEQCTNPIVVDQHCVEHHPCELDLDCGDQPDQPVLVCEPVTVQQCVVQGPVRFVAPWGLSKVYEWKKENGDLAAWLSEGIQTALEQRYAKKEAPERSPDGEIWDARGDERQVFSATTASRGGYFDVLYAAADTQSLRFAEPSIAWQRVGDVVDMLQEEHGVDKGRAKFAARMAYYVDHFDASSPSYLDALALPYNRVAAGWSAPEGSLLDVAEGWASVVSLVEALDVNVDAQITEAKLDMLIALARSQAHATRASATLQADAAAQNAALQDDVIGQITALAEQVGENAWEFQQGIVGAWECPSGFASCDAAILEKVQVFMTQCPEAPSLLDALSFAAGLVQGGKAAVTALQVVATLASEVDAAQSAIDGAESLAGDLQIGLSWAKDATKKLKGVGSAVKGAKDAIKWIRKRLELAVPDCEGSPAQAQMQSVLSQLAQIEATVNILEAQAGTLEAMLASVVAHVDHLTSAQHASALLASASSDTASALDALGQETGASLARQRDFIRLACRTTATAARTGLSDLHAVSQMLQSSVGRARVLPSLTVPRSPALSSGEAADRRDGFLRSVWDAGSFTQTFTTSGDGLSTPFLGAARERFDLLVRGEVCRANGPSPLVKHRMVVRVRLSDQAFEQWRATGMVSVAVGLDELMAAGAQAGTSLTALTSTPAFGPTVPLGGPFVLGVGYAACADEVCDRDLAVDAPHIFSRSAFVPSTSCDSDTVEVSADGASTCLARVAVTSGGSELAFLNAAFQNPALLDAFVEPTICGVDPDALSPSQLRGRPLLGSYDVTVDGFGGAPPGASWQEENADITGLQLFFFVGMEGLRGEPSYF